MNEDFIIEVISLFVISIPIIEIFTGKAVKGYGNGYILRSESPFYYYLSVIVQLFVSGLIIHHYIEKGSIFGITF